jgi:integrase
VPGHYTDGNGLVLHVVAPSRQYWTFRYRRDGRERSMALGNADLISLAEARKLHAEARLLLARGIDPLDARQQAKVNKAKTISFADAASHFIDAHRLSWRGQGESQWRQSIADHVLPVFGRKPVAEVSIEDVLRALQPIWQTRTPTAVVVRSRIEMVLDYARAHGWRPAASANPATWRGNLRSLLPPPARLHTVKHHAALPWREAPALMAALAAKDSISARCLRFLILTACRSDEARGARWDEIDLDNAGGPVWTIPASRMKMKKLHRVPLSDAAMDILRELAKLRLCDLIFFGHKARRVGAPMCGTSLKAVLRRLGHADITVHGMRSTFRDWCADTGKQGDLAEAALAHVVGNAVVRAYQRSDLLDARRALMSQWAAFLTQPPGLVVPFVSRAR